MSHKRMCDVFVSITVAAIMYSGCLGDSVLAQNPTCPTRPLGDSSNACASTAFTQQNTSGVLTIESYGASTSNSGAANQTAIQNAINSTPVGGTLLITKPNYSVSGSLTISHNIKILCANPDPTVAANLVQTVTNSDLFLIRSGYVTIEGCSMEVAGTPTGSATGVKIGDDAVSTSCTYNGTTAIVCGSYTFTSADVGKLITASSVGAGGAPLFTSIASVSAGTHNATLALAATGSSTQTTGIYFNYQEVNLIENDISNFVFGINVIAASQYHIRRNYVYGPDPLTIQNIPWSDSGIGDINGNTLISNTAGSHNVVNILSGGAIRFDSNEVLAQAAITNCVSVAWTGTSSVSPWIRFNSIEGSCTQTISVTSTSATVAGMIIGNHLGPAPGGTGVLINPTVTLDGWIIDDNVVRQSGGGNAFLLLNMTNLSFGFGNVGQNDGSGNFANISTGVTGSIHVGATSNNPLVNASAGASLDAPSGTIFSQLNANIATAKDGSRVYLIDGTPGAVCSGGGHGAWAERIAGAWVCTRVNPIFNAAARVGGFDIWQRIVVPAVGQTLAQAASTTAYQNDGWYLITGANQAATLTQSAGIAANSLFSAKVQRNSGQTGTTVMRYSAPLDSDEIAPLQGFNIALSFTMKEGANQSFSHTVNYNVYCGTGTPAKRGATPYTGEAVVVIGAVATTTTAARTTFVSGGTVPSNCTQMEIQFSWTPSGTAGADDSFTVDNLQLEAVNSSNSSANPYQFIDMQAQLAKAQRFLPAWSCNGINAVMIVAFGGSFANNTGFVFWPFPVVTRVPPTGIVFSNLTHFTMDTGAAVAQTLTAITVSATGATTYGATIVLTSTGTPLTIGQWTVLQSAVGATAAQFYLTGAEI